MQDDVDERRAQDKRDLEFFRSRIRPTCSDLWRIVESRPEANESQGNNRADELIWPLLASAAIFLLLYWAGMVGRLGMILP